VVVAGATRQGVLRLLVESPPLAASPKLTVKEAAERAFAADAASGVAYLFGAEAADDPELGRFLELSVAADLGGPWDLAYALERELPEGFRVEPDLPSSFGAADPDQAVAADLEEGLEEFAAPHDWALQLVRAPQAWALPAAPGRSSEGRGVVVGHPDTGYVLHAELEAAALDLARDADVIDDDDDASDPLEHGRFPEFLQPGHGTRTASVIVGRRGRTLTGVAPEAVLVPIRTVRSVIQIADGDVAKAVNHARRIGCHVVSMSLGGLGFSGLEQAINRAVREGLIVLAAAGNFIPFRIISWPARYRNCLAIAAINIDETPWKPSSRGSKIVVSAPGESVWVPDLANRSHPPVTTSSGTSFAVTHVAGAAACWLSYHGRDALIARFGAQNLQAAFVHGLRTSSRRVNGLPDDKFGAGILDVGALLQAPLADPSTLRELEEAIEVVSVAEEDFYELFPELDRETVDRRLATALGVDVAGVPELVARYGRELLHLVAEDRTLHEQLGGDESLLELERAGPIVSGQRLSLELAQAVGRTRGEGSPGSSASE
jgi:Subtilase family